MKMKNPKEFYKATINGVPSILIRKFFVNNYDKRIEGNKAVDLGCGSGNDTAFLLEKGFEVTAIDQEEQVREIIENRVLNKEKLNVIIDDFSKIEISNIDLLLANYSLFFVKDNFGKFVEKVLNSINSKGFFIGNFLGKEDTWNNIKSTVEKEEMLDYFKNYKILYFSEEKYYKDTATGKPKFWHVYNIIAQKN